MDRMGEMKQFFESSVFDSHMNNLFLSVKLNCYERIYGKK